MVLCLGHSRVSEVGPIHASTGVGIGVQDSICVHLSTPDFTPTAKGLSIVNWSGTIQVALRLITVSKVRNFLLTR